jgi:hypothetical protein
MSGVDTIARKHFPAKKKLYWRGSSDAVLSDIMEYLQGNGL